jgi:hypothetical protein
VGALHPVAFHTRDVNHFTDHELIIWRGGRWRHERDHWWWAVDDDDWYPYPEPIYPYPLVVVAPVAVVAPVGIPVMVPQPAMEPVAIESPAE